MIGIKHIFLVEDDTTEQALVEMLLLDQGFSVTKFSEGQAVLQQLTSLQSEGNFPDLVLLDVQLPDISGYEVCESIKEHALMSSIPIIMITSNDLGIEVEAGFDAGACEYITKPIDAARLISAIESIFILLDK